jgi:hypothetical protein
MKRGLAKATALLTGIKNGLSGWVLALKAWLMDPDYIFWLGTDATWIERFITRATLLRA